MFIRFLLLIFFIYYIVFVLVVLYVDFENNFIVFSYFINLLFYIITYIKVVILIIMINNFIKSIVKNHLQFRSTNIQTRFTSENTVISKAKYS